ncbi:MAG: formimidoylglutamate deiminase [Rhizobiaceae bacterium]|nr:formimidoylglutamate deiminase [Rhizobiaceae bacterium]
MTAIFAEKALLPDGWAANVLVEIGDGGRIESVRPDIAVADAERAPVLLPAVSNLHSHTFQRAMAGLAERRGPAERDSFWTWRETMYRFLDVLTPDDIEAIAALAFAEMLEAGFGAVAEFHYLHHQPGGSPYDDLGELAGRIAAAAQQSGIGLTLLPVAYNRGGVDGRPLAGGQLRFGNDLDRFVRLLERSETIAGSLPADTNIGVAPHSLRAVSLAEMERLAELRPHKPVHIHAAEQEAEIADVTAKFGARPVELLLQNFNVDLNWCLIHCTHMTQDETAELAASGAVAGLCPVTEANLGDGTFNGDSFVGMGGRFGVGSDSNIRITLSEELRQLEYSQRLRDRARVVLASSGQSVGRALYERALAGGARALGRNSGAIAAGGWADLAALSPGELAAFGADDLALDEWIFTGGAHVSDVWSAGRRVVRDGRHIDGEKIRARYRKALSDIAGRL